MSTNIVQPSCYNGLVAQVSECTTQADAARRLGVSRHRVNNLIQMGRIRVEHLADGTPVVPLTAIEEYARQREERTRKQASPPDKNDK